MLLCFRRWLPFALWACALAKDAGRPGHGATLLSLLSWGAHRLHHLALVVITAADLVTAASLFAGSSPEPGGGAVQVINARSEERIINKQTKRPFAASGSRRLLPSAICSGLILLLATLCCHQGDKMTQRDGQLVYLCTCLSCDWFTPVCTCAVCQGPPCSPHLWCPDVTLSSEQAWMKNNNIFVQYSYISNYDNANKSPNAHFLDLFGTFWFWYCMIVPETMLCPLKIKLGLESHRPLVAKQANSSRDLQNKMCFSNSIHPSIQKEQHQSCLKLIF